MLKLMYITNNSEIAKIAENVGVDRIFIDMEYIGKTLRQGGMDTVQSHHTINDIKKIKCSINKSKIIVRCNPIHESTSDYCSSKEEINDIIKSGADIIMLPFFKTKDEVQTFINIVDKRVKTLLLFETKEAVENVNDILSIEGIDEVFIGLNDLSLSYGMSFMFDLLANGTVENLCSIFRTHKLSYGFGGIARLGNGALPAEYIIKEHYRLGSSCVILSRSFCDINKIKNIDNVKEIFEIELNKIRELELECSKYDSNNEYFLDNQEKLKKIVNEIDGVVA